jgi:hypothetical protein
MTLPLSKRRRLAEYNAPLHPSPWSRENTAISRTGYLSFERDARRTLPQFLRQTQ